jgi:hypothetical protein
MSKTDPNAERAELAAGIASSLKDVSVKWKRLQSIDRTASGLQFRATLKACGLPGGLKMAAEPPLSAN